MQCDILLQQTQEKKNSASNRKMFKYLVLITRRYLIFTFIADIKFNYYVHTFNDLL